MWYLTIKNDRRHAVNQIASCNGNPKKCLETFISIRKVHITSNKWRFLRLTIQWGIGTRSLVNNFSIRHEICIKKKFLHITSSQTMSKHTKLIDFMVKSLTIEMASNDVSLNTAISHEKIIKKINIIPKPSVEFMR